jgi:hypothetical protein
MGVIGAVPGALFGAFILLAGILMSGGGEYAVPADGFVGLLADFISVPRLMLHASFVAASTTMFSSAWAAVWLRFRKRPDAATMSPAAVAAGTVAGSIAAGCVAAALAAGGLRGAFAGLAIAIPGAAFAGAFAATFLRPGQRVRVWSAAAVVGLLVTGAVYARIMG